MNRFKQFSLAVIAAISLSTPPKACAAEGSQETSPQKMTQYMFIGHVGPKGWQYILDNPNNRETAARDVVAKMGGELVGYYFGFGNSKNYIIVNLPDKQTAKAAQVLRLSSGMLFDYEIIELMSGSEIETIAKNIENLRKIDDIQKEE